MIKRQSRLIQSNRHEPTVDRFNALELKTRTCKPGVTFPLPRSLVATLRIKSFFVEREGLGKIQKDSFPLSLCCSVFRYFELVFTSTDRW